MLKKFFLLFIFVAHIQGLVLQTKVNDNIRFTYYEDKTGNLGIGKVKSLPMPNWNAVKINNFSHSSSAFWLRLEITNNSEYKKWMLYSVQPLNYLDVYLEHNKRIVYKSHVGTKVAYNKRDVKHRYLLFPLHLEQNQSYVVYLRIVSSRILRFDIRLYEKEAFIKNDVRELTHQAFFYGCFFILLIYNTVIGIFTRNIKYLYYCLYFVGVNLFLLQQEGITAAYNVHNFDNELHIFSILCAWLFLCLFVYYLLDVRMHFPRLKYVFHFFITAIPTISCLYFAGIMAFENNIKFLAVGILSITCSFPWLTWKLRHKNRSIIYFGLGWLSVGLASIVMFLHTEGFIPYNVWDNDISKSIIIFEAIAFSLALADRVNEEKEEKLHLQRQFYAYQEQEKSRLHKMVDEKTAQLKEATIFAEKASRAKSEFLALMSHELRTPLNAIMGFSYTLGQKENICRETRKDLQLIYQSGEHLLNIINMVLDLSKIEAERMELELQNVDLFELLQELSNIFSFQAQQKNIQFLFEGKDLPHFVYCDKTKVRQILLNVLSNALKFTEEGSVHFLVTSKPISAQKIRIIFTIRDTGSGIAQHEIQKVFQPFAQTKSGKQKKEGTGLGMAISLKFVQLMNGEISIDSVPMKGTTIAVDILVTVSEEMVKKDVHIHPLNTQPSSKLRVLIADDQEVNRLLLRKILTPFAFEIHEAHDGKQVIDLWQKYKPHLILLDIHMSELDGHQVIKDIKRSDNKAIIIVITAFAFHKEKQAIITSGCDDILTKPVSPPQLLKIIEKHLTLQFQCKDEDEKQKLSPLELMRVFSNEQKFLLKQAATEAEIETIQNIIGELSMEHTATIEYLSKLLYEFNYEKIVNLINKSNQKTE
ncbi:7TM diverse intracellular signaling domain-containing protein [Candidatus Uabimicrobium sp. HlEnr_7]|uniref:hybrid sensor histidine kinase/response regulator n=1 Tax=Candidatus Uabimicrobium helgolandensis TaxID=3095367 RepID=UPI003555FA71